MQEKINWLIKFFKYTITIVGVFGTVIGIVAYYENKAVNVEYEIIANTNVLDLNANISKLDITYNNVSLKESKKNIRLYTIKIINNGKLNLLKIYYDDKVPLGINIKNGKIVEKPQVIQYTNEYIEKSLDINYSGESITFSQVIIDAGEFFIVKLLVLHDNDKIPVISSKGKIAGQKNINVIDRVEIGNNTAVWKQVYEGGFLVQMLRIVLYFIIFIITVFIVGFLLIKGLYLRNKSKRKKIVNDFKESSVGNYNMTDEIIFDLYEHYGSSVVKNTNELIKSENSLNKKYNELKSEYPEFNYSKHTNRDIIYSNFFLWKEKELKFIHSMIKNGFIYEQEGVLFINKQFKEKLETFEDFIRGKSYSYNILT